MQQHIILGLGIALEAITHNKTRAVLTSLGIVFGVGSVISMLAVGTGAKQEILDQMKLLGANNIIITPVIEQEEGVVEEEKALERHGEEAVQSRDLHWRTARASCKHFPAWSSSVRRSSWRPWSSGRD